MRNVLLKICVRTFFFLLCLELFFCIGGRLSREYLNIKNKIKLQTSLEITVLCMGDSITYGGAENSYPNQLESYLNAHSHNKFTVINLAEAGKGSDYIAQNFQRWMDTYNPDYVVIMMGLFDSGLENQEENENWISRLNIVKAFKVLFKKKTAEDIQKVSEISLSKITEQNINTEDNQIKTALLGMPKNYQQLYIYAQAMYIRGEYQEEENIYRALLAVSSQPKVLKDKIYERLGHNLWARKEYKVYAQVMEHLPHFSWPVDWAERICVNEEMRQPLVNMLENRLQKDIKDHFSFELLVACYAQDDDQKQIERLEKLRGKKSYYSVSPRTKKNYTKILEILSERNSTVVLVQYPLRKLKILKDTVGDSKMYDRIIFVDNQRNFETALSEGRYKDYFVDRAAANFGHGTKKGNQLIAQSIAKEILKE